MKTMMKMFGSVALAFVLGAHVTFGQKADDQRMERDIEVAENVLSTLIKQHFEQQRMFFPLEIKGYYQPGYGVTFRLPADYTTPIAFSLRGHDNAVVWSGDWNAPGYSYRIETPRDGDDDYEREKIKAGKPVKAGAPGEEREEKVKPDKEATLMLKDKAREKEKIKRRLDMDSVKTAYNARIIEAAKSFIVDYGDLISQLAPSEKIIVTNQGERPRIWVGQYFDSPKRTHLSIEGTKSDVTAYKQGKATREQTLAKLKVINTEAVDKVEPDMELLSSIFNRLYRPDLSKTYFTEENIYYERLNDFGAIYYMQVYSSNYSNRGDDSRHNLPTVALEDVDQETRDKKVKELYPQFEQDLKENILEYGRTIKSLKDTESLIFNVTLTRCTGCGIPASIEVSVNSTVLKDFGSGKLDKPSALSKIAIKKGANQ